MSKIQLAGLLAMSVLTLLVVALVNRPVIDCSEPAVWGTEQGVRACAVNGGK